MERVAFLIERTGQRIGCLLNPASVEMRRVAGVRPRRSAGGLLTGAALADDPLIHTGGGRTELDLDLLFDVSVAGSSIRPNDVRDLTGPLWRLAENAPPGEERIPTVRFVWGKSWNVPGIVVAVSERLEHFDEGGFPRRSWLRMRLLRVSEKVEARPSAPSPYLPDIESKEPAPEDATVHELVGRGHEAGAGEAGGESEELEVLAGERVDELADRYLGAPWLWKALASFNDVADPLKLEAGGLLRIPGLSMGDGSE